MRIGKLRGFLAMGGLWAVPVFVYASGPNVPAGPLEQKVRH